MRATRLGASTGMGVCASAAQSPTLFGREDPIGRTDSPFGGGLEAVSRGAEQCDRAGGAWKQTAQRSGMSRKTSSREVQAWSRLPSSLIWVTSAVWRRALSSKLRICSCELSAVLRGLAPGDFLLLVELGEGQPQGERDERCGHGHVGESFSVCLFPAVHQQINAAEQSYQDQVGDEEAEEIRGLGSGLGLGGRFPSEGDEPSATLGTAQPRLNHAAAET